MHFENGVKALPFEHRPHIKSKNRKELQKIENKKVEHENNGYVNVFADFAVFSMVKTLVKINKENKFFKYRKDARLLHKIDENFQIKLSCTMHSGWIEEGFLGSTLKMDYCYFGDTINELKKMAHCCDFETNSVSISENLYYFLTPSLKKLTRPIGKCEIGNDVEYKMYWLDLNLNNITQPKAHGRSEERGIHWGSAQGAVGLKRELNLEHLRDEVISEYRAQVTLSKLRLSSPVKRNSDK